jgi:hypothetical protein
MHVPAEQAWFLPQEEDEVLHRPPEVALKCNAAATRVRQTAYGNTKAFLQAEPDRFYTFKEVRRMTLPFCAQGQKQQGAGMSLNFTPQFHRRLSSKETRAVWVPLPHPKTVIPVKAMYYRTWQQEESMRLRELGDEVLCFPISH